MKDKDLERLDANELKRILKEIDHISSKQKNEERPENDEQLHAWIKDNLGIDIPRIAVCPGHCSPFDPIADLFFNRTDAAIVVANRGGGKTMTAALWQFLNMRFTPEVECASVGAQEIQAKRAYSHFKTYQRKAGEDLKDISLISETVWKNGAKYEILTGSKGSVNGPHPQRCHRDEVELMDREVYQESLQMEKSKRLADGTVIVSQTLLTSTRKASNGLMQELLDDCTEAEKAGMKPPYKVYVYCIKETVTQMPNCRVAYPDLPESEKCQCHLVEKGLINDEPRTLEKICGGAFARSDGFMPIEDVEKTFVKTSKAMFDAQQLCKRPYTEDVSLEGFSRERNCIRGFEFDAENGPVYQGIDIGGTSPHAVSWIQVLDYEVEVMSFDGIPIRLPEKSRVLFRELYIAEIGNEKLADMIREVESELIMKGGQFHIAGRFMDPQAKLSKMDFREKGLFCKWPVGTRDREEHFKILNDLVEDGFWFVDIDHAPMFVEEIEVWNINKNKKKFDHAVDANLYNVSNLAVLEKNRGNHQLELPTMVKKTGPQIPNQFEDDGLPGYKAPSQTKELVGGEGWRKQFGQDI